MSQPKSKRRKEDDRFELRHGPYRCPVTRRGRRLFCENLGTVKVCRFSDGPIPWPMCTSGERRGSAFVICGDLVRAVRFEAAGAVARAWGVSASTVTRWRRILGVARFNPGTHELFLRYQGKGLTAEATARGRAAQTAERQAEWAVIRRQEGRTRKRHWLAEEDALLGTMPDGELAQRLGCSSGVIRRRRKELSIAPFIGSPLTASVVRGYAARLLQFSVEKLKARRLALGLFQTQVAERCGWKGSAVYQRLEAGLDHRATRQVLERVAHALECRVEDLLASR